MEPSPRARERLPTKKVFPPPRWEAKRTGPEGKFRPTKLGHKGSQLANITSGNQDTRPFKFRRKTKTPLFGPHPNNRGLFKTCWQKGPGKGPPKSFPHNPQTADLLSNTKPYKGQHIMRVQRDQHSQRKFPTRPTKLSTRAYPHRG